MIKKIIFPIFLAAFPLFSSYGQQETDLRELFLAAESYFLFEEFNEALPLYLKIHRTYPENDNINYKIGVCFLNNPYEKDKAITYLEEAGNNITHKYKENNFKETSAPPEVLYYLGNAYLVNNQIGKARENYKKFLEILDEEVYDRQLVLDQLDACDVAEKLMKKPIDYDRENLSELINTRFADMNPVISGDEKRMAFVSKLQFYDAIFFTEKVNGEWSPPRNIVPELGVDGDVYPTGMSYEGDLMYVYRSDNFIGNLYYTKLENGKWTPLVKLNENINTKYWESHATETKDGKYLYFSSNRKGGYGGLDIYRAQKKADGEWGSPVNLGPVVNSKYNDDTPFITEDGKKLFFSSYGHYNMGGYDIFMSKKSGDTAWAEPVNVGYPVNTTDDDQFFNPVSNGEIAYFPRYVEDGFGRTDIYRYEIYSPDNPRMFRISGLLDYMGNEADSSEIYISVLDKSDKDTLVSTHPNREGEFQFEIPAGSYDLVVDSDRFRRYMRDLEVAQSTSREGIMIPGTIALELIPPQLTIEEEDKKLSLVDSLVVVDDDAEVRVRFNAERGSDVSVRVFNEESAVIFTDSLEGGMFRQSIRFAPDPGVNKVEFTLTDKDGNIIKRSMEVIYNLPSGVTEETSGKLTGNSLNSVADSIENPVEDISPDTIRHDYLDLYKTRLEDHTTGALKEFINNLDLAAEGITSTEELLQFLHDRAETEDYSRGNVGQMLKKALSSKDLADFIAAMKRVSEGELRKTIEDLDPQAENLDSPRDVIDILIEKSDRADYEDLDVVHSLSELASRGTPDPEVFLETLTNHSEGKLRDYLSGFDMDEGEIRSATDLGVELYKRAKEGEADPSGLLDALTDLAVAGTAESLRQKLSEIAEGDLKVLLDTVDLRNNTAGQLIDFLYENPYDLNYTSEDVDRLLSDELYRTLREIDDFRKKMAGFAESPLKEFLENYDVRKGDFSSSEDFIDFLREQAASEGFSQDDINRALLKMAFKGNPDDLVLKFAAHTLGDLHQILLELDPEANNISTTQELIDYLLENPARLGYSPEDVMKMLSAFSSYEEAVTFLEKLIRMAEGETREYLQGLDPVKMGLETKQDLINRILKDADHGKADKEEVISLILRAEEISADKVLPGLIELAPGSMVDILGSLPAEISSGDELFRYLMEKSEDYDFSRDDVLNLFSDYLQNLRLYNFLSRLTEHAEGNLKKFLEGLNPSDEGIATPDELIRFLLKNAGKEGYSKEDVYHLLGKLIDQSELESFIQRLSNLASGGLLEALRELDTEGMNIRTIDDLIEYLLSAANKYGFDPAYLWDLITRMAVDDKAGIIEDTGDIDELISHARFKRALQYAGALLLLTGLLIFIIILFSRRKKRKKEEEQRIG